MKRPELQFLLDCSSPGRKQMLRPSAIAELDWDWLIVAARRHQVLPLLAARLKDCFPALSAHPKIGHLAKAVLVHQLRNQHLVAEWRLLLDSFDCADIPLITLKGPLLSELAYGDPTLRVYADLDLLVRSSDVPEAARLLRRLDFVAENYDERAFRSNFFHAAEANFRRVADGVRVDLHWRLCPGSYRFGPDGEEVWRPARRYRVDESEVLGLSSEDDLLYMSVHAARHGWHALSLVADVAHILFAREPDWDVLREIAVATRSTRMLDVGLILANQLLGVPLPGQASGADIDGSARRLASQIAKQLTGGAEGGAGSSRGAFNPLRLIERKSNKARFILSSWLEPTLIDWQFLPLPSVLYPAYYAIRQWRILLISTRRLMGRGEGPYRGEQ